MKPFFLTCVLLLGCGAPFVGTTESALSSEEPEAGAIAPSADGRVAVEAEAPEASLPEGAAPLRDVLADPWPADVVVEPWPCINCVPTFAGPMACCQGSDPNRTCMGHEGARYCEGCGCP